MRRTRRPFFLILLPCLLLCLSAAAPAPLGDAAPAKKPAGGAVRTVAWRHSGITGQTPEIYRSFRVDNETLHPAEPARAEQVLDAAPFRGKKVRLRAIVRAELPEGNHASLWLTVGRS